MGQKSSINFKPSKDHQVFHNTTIRPNYAIGGELEYDLKGYPARDLKNKIISQAIENYNKNKAPKAPKFKAKNYEWSAVVNIKPETTMDDLKKLAEHLNKKYGFQCYQITIHRDEGHINDDGEKEINHHAHLELITLDKETGKQRWNFTPKKLRELQTEVAEILQMERGIDKRISGAKRIEPRVYAEMKEKERANQKALKTELNSVKKELKALSANAIRKRVEQERKAWLNTNKALHEQGAEPIFIAEHYKELRELGKKAFTSLDELENALKELEKRIRKEKRQHQSNRPQISTTQKDFKSRLIDEFYSDLSTKHDLTPFYFNKELKTLENKQKGYKIKDSENALTLTTSKKADLSEQVALMLDMAKSKGWELDSIKVSGSKAFCDEVAKQIAEIKAKEKAEQAQKLKELEQENERLKAELAKNRTETALETQNEPKANQDITQSEKTQENAPKAKSQAQMNLEIVQKLDKKPIWEQTDTRTFYNILQRLEMRQEQQILERKLNEPKISCPSDFTSYAINKLNELMAKEIEKEKEQPKTLSDDEKRREAELKEIERLKAQGNFNYSTKSQSQDKSRNF
ncbi:MAG: LPD7 domain-containing protein [Campylobacter sp.]|nr:LPD7 domain-containing protein [Campylobacter sp.]